MGALADRLAFLLKRWGSDPSVRQPELHALASLEGSDPKEALARFHELKRAFAVHRRAELFHHLSGFPFVTDAPSADAKGYDLKEIERDVRAAERALAAARRIATAFDEADANRAKLRVRPVEGGARPEARPWDALAPLEDAAEAWRRAVARELRVEERAAELRRRAARVEIPRIDVPDVTRQAFPSADDAMAALDALEPPLKAAEALRDAFEAATRPLSDPAVREQRAESRKRLERRARDALAAQDGAALVALREEAEALRVEAARVGGDAVRARRSGRAPPSRERRAGDPMDGYG